MRDVNEFMRELAAKRQAEEKQNPELKNLPVEEPIICRGVADVITQPSTETEEDENIMN